MQTLRIFISSPGDVQDERQVAGKVIERLQGKYWSFVRLDDVFWEEKVVRSTAHYQDELANPGNCEIVVGILWSRLGSPLPDKFRKATGDRYSSGTEWELEMAFDAYERNLARSGDPLGVEPDIVVYRRTRPREAHDDPVREAEAVAQEQALAEYLRQNFLFGDGTIKRPVSLYQTLDEFEDRLAKNLEELILRKIPSLKPGYEPPPISGSPFKGLFAFEFADNDRYFGRNREIREMQDRLRAAADKGLPFLLIYGGSGYGKSSLMRAGLAPVLTRPGGSLPGIDGWRRITFQPAKGEGSLCERLAHALLRPPDPTEAEQSRRHEHWPLSGVAELAGTDELWDCARLTRHFSDDVARTAAIAAIAGSLAGLNRHLLLEIDQAEEVFTTPGFDAAQRAAFFSVVRDLCESGRVWVVATMRSEFFPRIAEQAELLQLVGKERGYILAPPDRQALREMIRYPALAARLDYQRRSEELVIGGEQVKFELLDDQILADAEASPDSLPLLAFTLHQLYEGVLDPADPARQRRTADLLPWATYQKICGLKGAIAKRAREVYDGLSPAAKQARHRIFAALVHVDPARHTFARQRAPRASLGSGQGTLEFIAAFLAAHLLVSDEDEQGRHAVVTLAHDALISHWDELAAWNQEHQGDLLARQRLREQTALWSEGDRQKSYLLSEARLAEAERVVARGLFTLTEEEEHFLTLSKRRSTRKLRLLQTAVAVFALLAAIASVLGLVARNNQQRAVAAEVKTAVQLKETQRQLERSMLEEGRSWLERANAAKNNGDHLAAMIFAGRTVGYQGYGRKEREDAALEERFPRLLGNAMTDPMIEQERQVEIKNVAEFMRGITPTCLPLWSSPLSAHHASFVTAVAFSRDGSRLASASGDKTIKLWDPATGKQIAHLQGHDKVVNGVAFSPDGSRLASCSDDESIVLWELASGRRQYTILDSGSAVKSVAFSPDGSRLASASGDGSVVFWNVANGTKLSTLRAHATPATGVFFSPDGKSLATTADRDFLKLWDCASGSEIKVLESYSRRQGGPKQTATSVSFSPDGTRIAFDSDDSIVIAELASGKELLRIEDHADDKRSVVFSPDGNRLASTTRGESIKIWDALTGRELTHLTGHTREVASVAFSPDGTRLASGSGDWSVRLWEVASGRQIADPAGHQAAVTWVACSPDGSRLASASVDNSIKIWDAATGRQLAHLAGAGHDRGITCVAFSPDGMQLASSSYDGLIKLWDAVSGKVLCSAKGHRDGVLHLAFSHAGSRLASASSDNSIKLWDPASGKELAHLSGHSDGVRCVAFSPDDTYLASASDDCTVRLWNASSGEPMKSLEGHPGPVKSVVFSPDGSRLVSACESCIKVWDAHSGACLVTLSEPVITGLAYAPDGTRFAASTRNSSITIWDATSGKKLNTIHGHMDDVNCVAFSPDGSRLVSGSSDHTVKFWDCAPRGRLRELVGGAGMVWSVAWSPDGTLLASAARDGTIKFWNAATGRELRTVPAFAGDPDQGSENVRDVVFSPDGSLLAGAASKWVKLWDVTTGREFATLQDHEPGGGGIVFSPDGTRLAAPNGCAVRVWDTGTGKTVTLLQGHEDDVRRVVFCPDGKRLVSASRDGSIKLWDLSSGRELANFKGLKSDVFELAISPDGSRLASASNSEGIKIWNIASGTETASISGRFPSFAFHLAFSFDGLRLGAKTHGPLEMWDSTSGEKIPHPTSVQVLDILKRVRGPSVAINPDATEEADIDSDRVTIFDLQPKPIDLMLRLRHGLLDQPDRVAGARGAAADFHLRVGWSDSPEWMVTAPSTSGSLLENCAFSVFGERSDTLEKLGDDSLSPQVHAELRMRLCAELGQAGAATALWQQLQQDRTFDLNESASIRRFHLATLIDAARRSGAADHATTRGLATQIAPLLTTEMLAQPTVSLGLIGLIQVLAKEDHPDVSAARSILMKRLLEAVADTNPVRHQRLANFFETLGEVVATAGNFRTAREFYESSLSIRQQLVDAEPDNFAFRRDLGRVHAKLGATAKGEEMLKEAGKFYQQCLAIRSRLAEEAPDNAGVTRELALVHERLGEVAEAQGNLKSAWEAYGKALPYFRRLAEAEPKNAEAQRDAGSCLANLGNVALKGGATDKVRVFFETCLSIRRDLANQYNKNAEFQLEFAIAHFQMSRLAAAEKVAEEQTRHERECYQTLKRMQGMQMQLDVEWLKLLDQWKSKYEVAAATPEAAGADGDGEEAEEESWQDWQRRLAGATPDNAAAKRELGVEYTTLAKAAKDAGELKVAREAYDRSLSLFQELATAQPGNALAQRDLGYVLSECGILAQTGGDAVAARENFEKSLVIRKRLAEADPGNSQHKRDLVCVHFQLARLAEKEKNPEDAKLHDRVCYELFKGMVSQGMKLDKESSTLFTLLKKEFESE